jgi:hypothetical protein
MVLSPFAGVAAKVETSPAAEGVAHRLPVAARRSVTAIAGMVSISISLGSVRRSSTGHPDCRSRETGSNHPRPGIGRQLIPGMKLGEAGGQIVDEATSSP